MRQKEKFSNKSLHTNCKNEGVGNPQSINQQLAPSKIYLVRETGQFKRSLRRSEKRGHDMSQLERVIELLASSGQLPPEFLKHPLHGKYKDYWGCHLSFDWVLIWKQDDKKREITLSGLGTHTEFFDKKRH